MKSFESRLEESSDKAFHDVIERDKQLTFKDLDLGLDKHRLYNFVSGKPAPDNVKERLSSIRITSEKYLKSFESRLVEESSDKAFHDVIERNKQLTFKATEMSLKVKKTSLDEAIKIQKYVLRTLLAESNKKIKVFDVGESLAYPFCEKSPTLCTSGGGNRKTQKSSLTPFLETKLELADSNEVYANCNVFMQNLAAYVQSVATHCKVIKGIGNQ